MKESVAAEAPLVPPETGASTNAGLRLLQPGNGCALLCSLASDTAAAISEVLGLMVEQSISSEAFVPPACPQTILPKACAFTASFPTCTAGTQIFYSNRLQAANKVFILLGLYGQQIPRERI